MNKAEILEALAEHGPCVFQYEQYGSTYFAVVHSVEQRVNTNWGVKGATSWKVEIEPLRHGTRDGVTSVWSYGKEWVTLRQISYCTGKTKEQWTKDKVEQLLNAQVKNIIARQYGDLLSGYLSAHGIKPLYYASQNEMKFRADDIVKLAKLLKLDEPAIVCQHCGAEDSFNFGQCISCGEQDGE